jgi:hypothetical protein
MHHRGNCGVEIAKGNPIRHCGASEQVRTGCQGCQTYRGFFVPMGYGGIADELVHPCNSGTNEMTQRLAQML